MLAQAGRDLLGLFEQHVAHLRGVGHVHAERLLLADALGLAVGDDGAVVEAVGERLVTLGLGKPTRRRRTSSGDLAEVADRAKRRSASQPLGGLRADAPDPADRQRREERGRRRRRG